jgi:pimeloyl-ACP methyl ester carboxylesterase
LPGDCEDPPYGADVSNVARWVTGFTVVGHDWGGIVGWWIATCHAERLEQLIILNAPHPSVWREAVHSHPEQRRRSWYVLFFQLPWLPEVLLRQRRF